VLECYCNCCLNCYVSRTELLNESVASVNSDLLAGATFTPSASLANVTDMWPDSLLTQLLNDPATAIEGKLDKLVLGLELRFIQY
jgi:hypothetical protein